MRAAWVSLTWAVLVAVAAAAELYDSALHEAVLDPELCQQHLEELSSFVLYDSSFRVPQSVLQGNLVSWGNFHQCLDLGRNAGADADAPRGKHCVISLNELSVTVPELPQLPQLPWSALVELPWRELNESWTKETIAKYQRMKNQLQIFTGSRHKRRTSTSLPLPPLTLGVCIPETCTPRQALAPYLHNALLDAQYSEACRLPGDRPYAPADYVSLVVFPLIGLLTLLSTGYELYHRFVKKDKLRAGSILSVCSLYRNGQQVLSVGGRGAGVLKCLDGIRALSIIWVILGHSLIKMALSGFYNWVYTFEWFVSPESLYINAANISVDTFFMLSGLLTIYTSAHKMSQKSLLSSLHLFYLNRLLRMFPLLATAVLLQAGPMHRISDGANWGLESMQVQLCRDNWWAALLHIQNYYNPREECLPHTWYLSVDVQLHLLSPLVLVWALGARRAARVGVVSGAALTLAASTAFCFIMNMATSAGTSFPNERGDEYYRLFYLNTLTRAPVYCIGMAYGYLLNEHRNSRLRIPTAAVCGLWAAAAALAAGVFYMFHLTVSTADENQVLANLTNAFQRPAWALALGWVIVACVHGYAGPINWFLSLPVWQFVSRISYAMYIFHYPIQWAYGAAAITPEFFSSARLWTNFQSDLSLTILVSVVFVITIDSPFAALVKKALDRLRPAKTKPLKEVELTEKGAHDVVVDSPRSEAKLK